jgi:branched-chain amino acid transport system substrate-binding protein
MLAAALWGVAQADVIKIGAVLPFSGENAFLGEGMREGMQYALAECGPTHHQYKLIFEDSEYKPGRASLVAQKFANVDKVNVICSIWGPTAMAVCPISEGKKILHMAGEWDLYWTQKYHYTINLAPFCDDYAAIQYKMIKRWSACRIAILQENSADYNYAVPDFLAPLKNDKTLTIVYHETYNVPVQDFRTMLIRVKEAKPDILLVWGNQPETEIILRQSKEMGLTCRITGYFEALPEPKIAEGISYISDSNPDEAFNTAYRAKYKHEPPFYASYGYDQMQTIIKGFEKFPDKAPGSDELIKAMTGLSPWRGASGMIYPGPSRNFRMAFKILKYDHGRAIPSPDFADLNKEMGW